MRIEDELRQLQTPPRAEAWEKFQAARAAASDPVAEAAGSQRPTRRLVPYWAWAAAGVACVVAVGGLWVPNAWQAVPQGSESAGTEIRTTPSLDPAAKQQEEPLPEVTVAEVPSSSTLRKGSPKGVKHPVQEVDLFADANASRYKTNCEGTPEVAQGPVDALFSRSGVISGPFMVSTSPDVYVAETGAPTTSSSAQQPPKANRSNPPTSAWFQLEVTLDNGNLYDLNDLRRSISPKPGHWKQSAVAFAQKQWENLRRGERSAPSWALPEALTVTIDFKTAAQRLPANPFNRNDSPKNNP